MSKRIRVLAGWRGVPSANVFAKTGLLFAVALLVACGSVPSQKSPGDQEANASPERPGYCTGSNTINAEVVALEQAYVLNRFGAYVPAGMMYALMRDVQAIDADKPAGPGNARLRGDKRPRPLVLRAHEGGCLQVTLHNWLSPTWEEEGGQPLSSMMLAGGVQVPGAPAHMDDADGITTSRRLKPLSKMEKDAPRTRSASLFVTGLESDRMRKQDCPVNAVCGGDGTYVGLPTQQGTVVNDATAKEVEQRYRTGSLIPPGGVSVIRWIARREGTFFAHSMGAPVGGEGDGGQIGLGLFAAVNVEPPDSKWYRSQLTHDELQSAKLEGDESQHPFASFDYEMRRNGKPVMALLNGSELVYSDLNAVIVRDERQRASCTERLKGNIVDGQRCEPSFREFTVILHDEVHAQQAFRELEDEDNALHYLKDGMGINYGVSSMGSLLVAAGPQRGVGPAANCPECRAEEFFLSSWANGDPALVLQWDAKGEKPIGARYPDDPSNVHHSYLGDPVVFRNLHAGPKETHVFHLHAHQWVLDASDPNSTYLDSQTISPGATFSYGIEFGGSGNRNYTPGDSIFHCHLYPHFAQGMWELWRVHDVFESGLHLGQWSSESLPGKTLNPQSRSLPDAEIVGGTASPALVPLPGLALAPMPSAEFRGYPFYIPGSPGHRPPQPALDMDVTAANYSGGAAYESEPAQADIVNGGLPRHVVANGSTLKALNKIEQKTNPKDYQEVLQSAISKGGLAAQVLAQKVYSDYPMAFQALAGDWDKLTIKPLNHSGEPDEKKAMSFHEGKLAQTDRSLAEGRLEPVAIVDQPRPYWWTHSSGYRTSFAALIDGMAARDPTQEPIFHVNGRGRAPGSPYANPCPENAPARNYKSAFIQTEITVNKHGWFDPQGRMIILEDDVKDVIDASTRTKMPEPLFFRANSGDCINFKSSNFMPSALNGDDFQIYTPTDTIGQHIHLVKFDVTSSDGSANGWNYEDATFSPDEVRERIVAHNRTNPGSMLKPKVHPLFQADGNVAQSNVTGAFKALLDKGQCPDRKAGMTDHEYLHELSTNHPYCAAQRTTQRWWADPILVRSGPQANKDNTLRTVFTHDHLGPSSHQQHGLYAALVIEPANSIWQASPFDVDGNMATLDAKCVAPNLRARAQNAGVMLQNKDPANSDVDDAVYVAFAVMAASQAGLPKSEAQACLNTALLGGSDLSKNPVALTTAGDKQLELINPRPVWQNRNDGGPTSARATIVSPTCLDEANSSPALAGKVKTCLPGREANQSRREFGLAFADFAGVYNLALEPVNPETPRDINMRRFGERQVPIRASRPIAISSEDPGTQLINYRHEPLALRIADVSWSNKVGGFDIGGFNYSQSQKTVRGGPCQAGDLDCLGDMANAFSTLVHARRDRELATQSYLDWVAGQTSGEKPKTLLDFASPRLKQLTSVVDPQTWTTRLGKVMADAEDWRRDFNCALYSPDEWSVESVVNQASPLVRTVTPGVASVDGAFRTRCSTGVNARKIRQPEPWRYFGDPATPILAAQEGDPIQIRLIQGAQEAQHIFTMNGVKWHRLPDSPNSGFVNAQPIGISEHFEFDIRVPNFKLPFADYLYFGASVDQLWDGMWGVMRAFQRPDRAQSTSTTEPKKVAIPLPARTDSQIVVSKPERWLGNVPNSTLDVKAAEAWDPAGVTGVCTAYRKDAAGQDVDQIAVHSFDVSAVKACDLTGDCAQNPLTYSRRFGITDPLAVVYVQSRDMSCQRGKNALVTDITGKKLSSLTNEGCFDQDSNLDRQAALTDAAVLAKLQMAYRAGKTIEPMVLRAAAGECITVKLRNHLSIESLMPSAKVDAATGAVREGGLYHNFLPMIADGFNLNQFKMSNTVGISAPRLMQNPVNADGANVGINGAVLLAGQATLDFSPGSLQPPCKADSACSRNYVWAARDLVSDSANNRIVSVPTEFGALPLRSFGDPVKQPMHGLVGAMVIGPEGSQVCAGQPLGSGGISAKVCTADGKVYGDHVLVMQDAVNAVQYGFPVPDLRGAEEPDDYGVKAINYKTEPLWARRGGSPSIEFGDRNVDFDYTTVFSSRFENGVCESGVQPNGTGANACDPETPVFRASAGELIRLHFVHPGGHTRQQGLTVSGHGFHPYPWASDSHQFAPERCWPKPNEPLPTGCLTWQGVFNGFGPMMGTTLGFKAGGTAGLAKDYLVRSQASFLLDGGLWSILRVEK